MKSDYIGTSTIEFFGILDDPRKMRTIEADTIGIEQMELFDDFAGLMRDVGSRLRGTVRGRKRLGRLMGIANAGINPDMWWLFNKGMKEPDGPILSVRHSTYDNIHLDSTDFSNMKRRVTIQSDGDTEQWLEAKEPEGDGEHFSAMMLKQCFDPELNTIMNQNIENEAEGWITNHTERAGVIQWEAPPDPYRTYITIGDPGQGNPPARS